MAGGPTAAADGKPVRLTDGATTEYLSAVEQRLESKTVTGAEAIEEIARRMQKKDYSWLIDPRRSKFIGYWDMMTTLALVFTATVTPYEVALIAVAFDALFVVNRVVDSIFLLDILVNFCIIREVQLGSQGSHWITEPGKLCKMYLSSWFALDTFSVAVSGLDIYVVMLQQSSGNESQLELLEGLASLKVVRVLRLFKLVRLLRSSRIAKRWETRVAIDYSVLAIVKCFFGVLVVGHWMACVWLLQGFLSSKGPMNSWLGDDQYCVVSNVSALGYTCQPHGTLYATSLYWAVMTITSVGYGDIGATYNNPEEMVVCTVLMLISAFLWAHVIGTYCGVVATFNPEQNAFQATMDELNRFMNRENMPSEMRRRMREYFHQSKHLQMAETQKRLMNHMAPSLKGECVWMINRQWLEKIWFLKSAPHLFMTELAMTLQAMVYAPADTPKVGFMYIVHRGVALYQAKLMTKGKVWGEDMILSTSTLRSTAQARAMNYLEVYFVSRHDLIEVAARYPMTSRRIRRAAIMLALRREMILHAKVKLGMPAGDMLGTVAKLTVVKTNGTGLLGGTLDQGKSTAAFVAKEPDEEQPMVIDRLDDVPIGSMGAINAITKGGGGAGGGMSMSEDNIKEITKQLSSAIAQTSRQEIALLKEEVTARSVATDVTLKKLAALVDGLTKRLDAMPPPSLLAPRKHLSRRERMVNASNSMFEDPAVDCGSFEAPGDVMSLASCARQQSRDEDRKQDGLREARRERPSAARADGTKRVRVRVRTSSRAELEESCARQGVRLSLAQRRASKDGASLDA